MSDYDVDLSDLYADLADIDVNPSDTFVVIGMALTGQEHFFSTNECDSLYTIHLEEREKTIVT